MRAGLQARLGQDAEVFAVGSAGTRGLVGLPIEPLAAEVLTGQGITTEGFRARRLEPGLLADVDLVLGASREHRSAAVAMAPRVLRRAFTLREFARIVSGWDSGDVWPAEPQRRARAVVDRAAGGRMQARAADPVDDDIADPMGRDAVAFAQAGAVIGEAVTAVLDALIGREFPTPATGVPVTASERVGR